MSEHSRVIKQAHSSKTWTPPTGHFGSRTPYPPTSLRNWVVALRCRPELMIGKAITVLSSLIDMGVRGPKVIEARRAMKGDCLDTQRVCRCGREHNFLRCKIDRQPSSYNARWGKGKMRGTRG